MRLTSSIPYKILSSSIQHKEKNREKQLATSHSTNPIQSKHKTITISSDIFQVNWISLEDSAFLLPITSVQKLDHEPSLLSQGLMGKTDNKLDIVGLTSLQI